MIPSRRSQLFRISIYFLTFFILISYSNCALSNHSPKAMDYELRRPITYLYNRLAYKFDFNPYTSHLVDTESHCSSRTGPFCKFINHKELMPVHIIMNPEVKLIHQTLLVSAPSNRQAAFQIEEGKLDAFLISGEYNKKFDQSVKKFIQKDIYDPLPSHKKLINQKKQKEYKRSIPVLISH